MKTDPAYKSAGKGFYIVYYMSALLPQYFMLLCSFIVENLESNGFTDLGMLGLKKVCVGISIVIITLLGFISFGLIGWDINTIRKDTEFYGHQLVTISRGRNIKMIQFLNDTVVPIIISLPCTNLPLTSLLLLFGVQMITMGFYHRSLNAFPNLSLYLLGYNVYKTKSQSNNNIRYVLVKQNFGDERLTNTKRNVIPFIPRSKNSRFAVYVKKDE